MSTKQYDLFKRYQVNDVKTVLDFLEKYYKHDRYKGRGEDYSRSLLASNINDFNTIGFCCISRHDSINGNVVSFYNENF